MRKIMSIWRIAVLLGLLTVTSAGGGDAPTVVIAEGTRFSPRDDQGWRIVHQDDSWASHSYGGMWVMHGGLIGAPAGSIGSVAEQTVTIPADDAYRVWSRYQAPPYFRYRHQIEVLQDGDVVHSHIYGELDAERLWSFSAGLRRELWWRWGMDHDAAEAPETMVDLKAGEAVIRLTTVENPAPAGDPMIDFVVLTTNPENDYQGFRPYRIASPFLFEAIAASELYMRFRNTTDAPAQLNILRRGHLQPNYGTENRDFPDEPVAAGEWSPWFNIGSFCRLAHEEGIWLRLPEATAFPVQVARDAAGQDLVGDIDAVRNGEAVVIPIDITWNTERRVRTSREHAEDLIRAAREEWRTANQGGKPRKLLFYGEFRNDEDWALRLKDALGFNTMLPEPFETVEVDALYHPRGGRLTNMQRLQTMIDGIADRNRTRVISFGDEIHLPNIDFDDPESQENFSNWVEQRGLIREDLGVEPEEAKLADRETNPRIYWYAQLFSDEQIFKHLFRAMTGHVEREVGPQALTGANYSPHKQPQFYGPLNQWIDIFKHRGMSMFWTEDYIFSVPQPPQIISWLFAKMHCATKYHDLPIHMYVMPHAPGQLPEYLRRNMIFSVGAGAAHINNYWLAPAEGFSENFISWHYPESFRAVHEAIFDSAEIEDIQVGGRRREGRIGVVVSRATDINERRTLIDPTDDQILERFPDEKNIPRITGRMDQQMLYMALRHAQHGVNVITEDDILGGYLRDYDVVYFAGEWIDHRVPAKLETWVREGGTLYATAGLGYRNEFDQPFDGMLDLLGLQSVSARRDLEYALPYLEMPHLQPIDTLTLGDDPIPAIGLRQVLTPVGDVEVLGTWSDGSAAVTRRILGEGRAIAVGTLAGTTYMRSGVRKTPWARGGRRMVYNPTDFDAGAIRLVLLATEEVDLPRDVECSNPLVEGLVIDNDGDTLLTLTNWDNEPQQALTVRLRMPSRPSQVRSVQRQTDLDFDYADGWVTFETGLEWADYFIVRL